LRDIEGLPTTASQSGYSQRGPVASSVGRRRGGRAARRGLRGGGTARIRSARIHGLGLCAALLTEVDDHSGGKSDRKGRSSELRRYGDVALPILVQIGSCLCGVEGERAFRAVDERELPGRPYAGRQVTGQNKVEAQIMLYLRLGWMGDTGQVTGSH